MTVEGIDRNLAGSVALVTGGSRGLGRAIARRLAAGGASVVVNHRDSGAAAESLVAEITAGGGTAVSVQADVSDVAQITRLFDSATEQLGVPTIVVANAGRHLVKPIGETTEADFDEVFGLNARGTFFVLREAARRMPDGGRIIALGAGSLGGPLQGGAVAANASKGAVQEAARALAAELGPRGITVNLVSPGPTATENFHSLPPERQAAAARRAVLGRVGDPDDIADVVAFLAGSGGRWITGQTIRATGGG